MKHTPMKSSKMASSSEEDLSTLVLLRGMAQGNITRIKNILTQAQADQAELPSAQVKVYVKKVEGAYNEYHQHHQQIVAILPSNKKEEQNEKFLQFETLHEEVSIMLETLLEAQAAPPAAQQVQPPANQQPLVIQQSLPRAIPTFDGRYENWERFKIMFRDAVDRTNEAPRIKLYHLEKALVGDAAGIIDVKTIADGNYAHAWELLEERFDDQRRMIDIHIAGLLGVKKLSKEDFGELRSLVESTTSHVENLKFLDQEFTGVSELIVVHLIARALDPTTKKLWESTIKRGELPNYEDTIQFLKDRVSVLERCRDTAEEAKTQRTSVKPATRKQAFPNANAATAPSSADQRCTICDESHVTYKCSVFNGLSVSDRLAKVKQKNVCYNCLRSGHSVKNCPSKKSCSKCNKRHHTLLHLEAGAISTQPANENSANGVPGSAQPTASAVRQQSAENQPSVTAAHSNNPVNPASQVVLLTALVNVMDHQQRPRVCKALLDCGSQKQADRVMSRYLTIPELRAASNLIVGAIQHQEFAKEIECVRADEPNHRLNNLKPFLDEDLLRVGGRLGQSQLPFGVKHQLILPSNNPIVHGLISDVHRENHHAGNSMVQYLLRQHFWLINARSTIRKVLRTCVTCFRTNPTTIDQQMGDLPSYRINPAPVFERVGLDFAGPIYVKQSVRKATPVKSYICVFICMVTKAMHLEAVEDLSTDSFLAAFQRFVSRRGYPKEVFSDNGTNFIGARSALQELYRLFKEETTQNKIFAYCQAKQIVWKTIPPNAPHFGGLWEAGVKSVKTVLKRVYQSTSLTLSGLSTLLCQIEAILNSRPLYSQSNNPTEPEALTPGHFIANRPLLAIPEPSVVGIPTNRLSHWQHIQQLREHFWKRWSREYLTELQVRGKWTKQKVNIQPGMVVLLKDDNLPPQCWNLGRVERVHPNVQFDSSQTEEASSSGGDSLHHESSAHPTNDERTTTTKRVLNSKAAIIKLTTEQRPASVLFHPSSRLPHSSEAEAKAAIAREDRMRHRQRAEPTDATVRQ
ncbi:uncharacterized protein LOC134289528 [Aedes albopictus]|uniref:Uncharacterized protein n=1 Tax=Aedes albopictus TaxID=7160 RepID=A0ABM1Y9K0_AEDAL